MTGYGRGESVHGAFTAVAEINSVNRRQLDVRLQLPHCLASRETRFAGLVKKRLSRGQVTGFVSLNAPAANKTGWSREQTRAIIEDLRETALELGLPDDLRASHLLQLSSLKRETNIETPHPDAEHAAVKAFEEALDALCVMRAREGERLRGELEQMLVRLQQRLDAIAARAPAVVSAYRSVLQRRLAEAEQDAALEDDAFRRELLLFASRSDVTEEITRLRSHFEQTSACLQGNQATGRALDFLAQEMSREINTLGAKAADVAITRMVVKFKTELDRFREQVQNME